MQASYSSFHIFFFALKLGNFLAALFQLLAIVYLQTSRCRDNGVCSNMNIILTRVKTNTVDYYNLGLSKLLPGVLHHELRKLLKVKYTHGYQETSRKMVQTLNITITCFQSQNVFPLKCITLGNQKRTDDTLLQLQIVNEFQLMLIIAR